MKDLGIKSRGLDQRQAELTARELVLIVRQKLADRGTQELIHKSPGRFGIRQGSCFRLIDRGTRGPRKACHQLCRSILHGLYR